jgi:hypothetical protein
MIKSLSPAAQAVLDAATFRHGCIPASIAAAALQAAADQVVPRRRKPMYANSGEESAWSAQQDTRDELLASAYELEAHLKGPSRGQ